MLPKTKNAFAFRDFDAERILQRPYFKEWREKYHVDTGKTDAEILSTLAVTDAENVKETEFKNRCLAVLDEYCRNLPKWLLRHSNAKDGRLKKIRHTLKKKLDSSPNADNSFLQAQLSRELELVKFYFLEVVPAAYDLGLAVNKACRNSGLILQAMYKRQFGERLRQAREAAGFTRADLVDVLNITPNAYGLYETGKRDVAAMSLRKLAQVFNVSTDWLLGLK